MNIVEFSRFLWGDTISTAQTTWLNVNYGLPLTSQERALWRRYSEKGIFSRYSPREYFESFLIKGRQGGGSSRIGVTCSLFESTAVERQIPAGTRLAVLFVAPVLRQSCFNQTIEKLRATPELSSLIENDAAASGEVRLSNGIDLVNISANPSHARGRAAVLCVVDEASFIKSDSEFQMNLPELLESLRPSLIVNRGKLLLISSPSAKEGPLYEAWVNRAENPDVFVWRAPSHVMNPAIDPKLLERERKRGDAYFRREYLAEFVDAANPFIPPESLDAAVRTEKFERSDADAFVCAGIDLADKRDDCALSIAAVRNVEGKRKVVLLFAKAWKPGPNGHNVVKVLEEMGEICRSYRVGFARGDQKSMSTAEYILGRYGVGFERVVTDGAGSEVMYRTFLATLNNGDLLIGKHEELLLQQLRRLEEKTSDGNRFRVAGKRNSADDLAVSAMLSIATAAERLTVCEPWIASIFAHPKDCGFPEDRFFRNRF